MRRVHRAKRDHRHHTVTVNHNHAPHHGHAPGHSGGGGGRRSKSRSKSRSPGREIERGGGAAIVIVHHHTSCGHQDPRAASPDNLSESSISFHENEVNFDLSPGDRVKMTRPAEPALAEPPGLWYDGPLDPHGCVSVAREPGHVARDTREHAAGDTGAGHVAGGRGHVQYSNWESCRESWFSSGSSELRPSSGSDCPPPRPPSFSDSSPNIAAAAGAGEAVTNCVVTSSPATPHLKRTRDAGTSTPAGRGSPGRAAAATLPRSAVAAGGAVRQSSRDSGSSSSRPNSRPGTRPNTWYSTVQYRAVQCSIVHVQYSTNPSPDQGPDPYQSLFSALPLYISILHL